MMPVESMTLEELSRRLLDAFRNGRLDIDLKGFVLGFAKAMKRGKPSDRQVSLARKLIGEIRHHDGSEPTELIDSDDNEDGREMAKNYAEF